MQRVICCDLNTTAQSRFDWSMVIAARVAVGNDIGTFQVEPGM